MTIETEKEPEEEFQEQVFKALKRIKREFVYTPTNEYVDIHNDNQKARGVLKKIEEIGAIKIAKFLNGHYYLEILQPKFDELYNLYEEALKVGMGLKNIVGLTELLAISNDNEPSATKNQSFIKPKTLELIAREIGNLDTGANLVNFLTDCGVDPKLIGCIQNDYSNQSKWQLIYAVLNELATSPNPKNQEILFKIIEEASHPLMHNGDEESAKKYEDKFNRLLGYDGFTLRNYKLKKNIKEAEQDNDLDLYLKKKILVEKWRDDLPHPLKELSFNNNTLEQICYSFWDLFGSDIISFGANTFPEDILIETDPRFWQEIAFNWNLIRDLDNNPHKVEDGYGFDIEILNEKRLKKDIEEEIDEFIANKVEGKKIEEIKDFCSDIKFYETPAYLRGVSTNYYAYKKQKEIIIYFVANLYNKFENETLVIKFNEISDKNVNVLRTILALEKEGFFIIKELCNDKKGWIDKDSVYVKIQLVKSKIPAIKKFLSVRDKHKIKIEYNDKLPTDEQIKKPIPTMKIEGLKEGLEAIARAKTENKAKFPHKLPAGTEWQNIIIKFSDDENVYIQVKQFKHYASYKELGLVGKGNNPNPSESWTFLKVLAQVNGELAIKDAQARDKYKKQKELLTKTLQSYFSLDYDPFYPYRSSSEKQGNSYKIKITLIPPATDNEKQTTTEEDDDLGVKEYLKEQAPQV